MPEKNLWEQEYFESYKFKPFDHSYQDRTRGFKITFKTLFLRKVYQDKKIIKFICGNGSSINNKFRSIETKFVGEKIDLFLKNISDKNSLINYFSNKIDNEIYLISEELKSFSEDDEKTKIIQKLVKEIFLHPAISEKFFEKLFSFKENRHKFFLFSEFAQKFNFKLNIANIIEENDQEFWLDILEKIKTFYQKEFEAGCQISTLKMLRNNFYSLYFADKPPDVLLAYFNYPRYGLQSCLSIDVLMKNSAWLELEEDILLGRLNNFEIAIEWKLGLLKTCGADTEWLLTSVMPMLGHVQSIQWDTGSYHSNSE